MGTSGKPGEGDGPHGHGEGADDVERTQRLSDLLRSPNGAAGPPADDAEDTPDDAPEDTPEDTPEETPPSDDEGFDPVAPTERITGPIDLSSAPPDDDRPGPTDFIRKPGETGGDRPGPTDRIHYSPDAHHGEPDEDEGEDPSRPIRRPAGWAPAPKGFAPEPGASRPAPPPVRRDWGPQPGGPPAAMPGTPVAGPAASGTGGGGGPVMGGPSYHTTVQNQTIEQQNIAQQIIQGGGGPGGGQGTGGDDEGGAEHEELDDVASEVPAPVQTRAPRPEDTRRAARQNQQQPQGPGRLSDRLGQPVRPGRERERVVADTPALRGLPGGPGLRGDAAARRGDRPADRHTPGMAQPSVWQRLNLVWRDSGTDWERARRSNADWQPSGDAFLAGRKRRGPLPDIPRPLLIALAGVAVILLIIVGINVLGGRGGPTSDGRIGGASQADALFPPPAGARGDGADQGIGAIGRYGSRLVMTGREKGGAFDRPQFFSSSDGGATWTRGTVHGPNGGAVPPGGAPTRVVGGSSGWVALNIGNVPVWSSTDGTTWTQVPADQSASAFRDGDAVSSLVARDTGFLAVGTHTSGGTTTPVLWTSDDGKSWTRQDQPKIEVPGGKALKLTAAASRGDVLFAGGTEQKTVTKTVKKGKKKTKKKSSYTGEGFWISTDAAATWQPVDVPQADGSSGSFTAITADKQSFYVLRPGSGGHNAVVMASPDARKWKQSGSITGGKKDNLTVSLLTGADNGLAALGTLGNGHNVVFTSTDGKTFGRIGDLGPAKGRTIRGVEPSSDGAVAVGSAFGDDENDYVATASNSGKVTPVDLSKVAGAVHPDRTVADLRFAGGKYVAVGSANGDAAAWTSADGKSWKPATAEDGAFARSGAQRLESVAKGGAGWLAAGSSDGKPLVATSGDGASWSAADSDKAFGGSHVDTNAAGAGPAGYVVVGSHGDDAAAWSSKDLKTWTAGTGSGLAAPKGATATMNDVAAGSFGYVAVGSIDGDSGSEPAAWISSDGVSWTHVEMDLPQGDGSAQLTRIAVNGDRLVAAGVGLSGNEFAPFTMTSVDNGRSWQPAQPPGGGTADAKVTDVTPEGKGFALLATQGPEGATHVRLWTSADGTTWKARPLKGDDLIGGSSTEKINAATVNGGKLLGVGSVADAADEHVTLWRAPLT